VMTNGVFLYGLLVFPDAFVSSYGL
jgi:hypothetical protein